MESLAITNAENTAAQMRDPIAGTAHRVFLVLLDLGTRP